MITEYTRVTWNSQTIIDHLITNKPEHIATSGVIPCGISDHDVMYAVKRLKLPKRKKLLKRVTIRKYNKFEVKAFLGDLKKVQFDDIEKYCNDPDGMWEIWKNFFISAVEKHAPLAKITLKGNNLHYN